MAPRIKPKLKPKGKGVTKQEKAAATRAGFVTSAGKPDVAAYRKHKEKIKQMPSIPTGPSDMLDKQVADRLGITAEELKKKRKVALDKSLAAEAKRKNISVAKVEKLRKERSSQTKGSKRFETAKKRAYTVEKKKEKKEAFTERENKLISKATDGTLTSTESKELDAFAKQRKDSGRLPITIPLKQPEIRPAAERYEAGRRTQIPSEDSKIMKLRNERIKRFDDQIDKLEKAKTKIIKNKKIMKIENAGARKKGLPLPHKNTNIFGKRLESINKHLPILKERKQEAYKIDKFRPLYSFERSNKPLSGLSTLYEKVREGTSSKPEEPTAIGGKTQIKGMPSSVKVGPGTHPIIDKMLSKKEALTQKAVKDITRSLVDKGISERIALKVANKQSLTSAERKRVRQAGVKLTFGPWAYQRPTQVVVDRMLGKGTVPKSGKAPTPMKKLTEREKELQEVTKEPTPQKWKDFKRLQQALQMDLGLSGGVPVKKVKRAIGKTGQGRGKLRSGNLTVSQISDILGTEDLSKWTDKEVKSLLIQADLNVSKKKKGGTVYRKTGGQIRRGTGTALRGFGKATYSHKLY